MRDLSKPITPELLQRLGKFCKTKAYKKGKIQKGKDENLEIVIKGGIL